MRQSTTQKISLNLLGQLEKYLPKNDQTSLGFIVRLNGVEIGISYIEGHWLYPCQKTHYGMNRIHYTDVTIRKGMTLNTTQVANRQIAEVLACSINDLDIELHRLCEDDNYISDEKFSVIYSMILESYDHVWELKRS
jgi:hypothetical protein